MLEMNSSLVGSELTPIEHLVTWRETTNYAAALGDLNPRYFDDTIQGGIVAPPMLAVALTWPLVGNLQQLGGNLSPRVLATTVHATEHIIFHRLIRPGDRLKISGKVAAVIPTRAGTHFVIRVDALDDKGNPVFTEYNGAMFRGVKCIDQGRGKDNLPELPDVYETDPALWEVDIPVSPVLSYVYDGCTDIVFPIHTSPAFAKGVGLPGIILQGTATLALAALEILNREAEARPERLTEIACRFTGMVIPGTSIKVLLTAKQTGKHHSRVQFLVLNHLGEKALSRGYVGIGH